jgi:hypothetical protein
VMFWRGVPYRNIRPLSCFEIRRMLLRAGLQSWSMSPPRLSESEQQTLPAPARRILRLYHRVLAVPVFRQLLLAAGPFLQVVGRKEA